MESADNNQMKNYTFKRQISNFLKDIISPDFLRIMCFTGVAAFVLMIVLSLFFSEVGISSGFGMRMLMLFNMIFISGILFFATRNKSTVLSLSFIGLSIIHFPSIFLSLLLDYLVQQIAQQNVLFTNENFQAFKVACKAVVPGLLGTYLVILGAAFTILALFWVINGEFMDSIVFVISGKKISDTPYVELFRNTEQTLNLMDENIFAFLVFLHFQRLHKSRQDDLNDFRFIRGLSSDNLYFFERTLKKVSSISFSVRSGLSLVSLSSLFTTLFDHVRIPVRAIFNTDGTLLAIILPFLVLLIYSHYIRGVGELLKKIKRVEAERKMVK
ncbi:hypothetical protein RA086_08815 [Lactiplantibacillus sp. WILCCON 0030]|uniref:Integral membrane protein n=1 Tax=Lactiplantibacillus brownii TaxID=3069269 RepID=A0ABU1A9T8_9LACO|nr:hypothetical protein [Lactiplantibacillus brownii]MDQ7937709.1 hypothetical protein [Lactiplantibacillus brownii]